MVTRSGAVAAALALLSVACTSPDASYDLERLEKGENRDGSLGTIFQGKRPLQQLGSKVASIGDLDADGLSDLAICSSDENGPGTCYIVFGHPPPFFQRVGLGSFQGVGQPAPRTTLITTRKPHAKLGMAVSGGGDFNGDGFSDVVVSAPFFPLPSGEGKGAAFVVFGSNDPPPRIFVESFFSQKVDEGASGLVITAPPSSSCFAATTSLVGDFNADGLADVVVGGRCRRADRKGFGGEAFVVFGRRRPQPIINVQDDGFGVLRVFADEDSMATGAAVLIARDTNGDGIGELLVSSPTARKSSGMKGHIFVLYGRTAVPDEFDLSSLRPDRGGRGDQGFVIEGMRDNDLVGMSLASLDFDHDSLCDLVIGNPTGRERGFQNAGEVYIVFGSTDPRAHLDVGHLLPANGGDGSLGAILLGANQGDLTGWSLSVSQDWDGDEKPELLVGAPRKENGGSVFLVPGSEQFPPEYLLDLNEKGSERLRHTSFSGAINHRSLGMTLADGLDVDGDGEVELALGDPAYSFEGMEQGLGGLFLIQSPKNWRQALSMWIGW